MKILFISFDADPPYKGGTSTVVNVLAKAFQDNGHFVALGYLENSDHPSHFFLNKIKLSKENQQNITEFFAKYNFDIIYNALAVGVDFPFEFIKLIAPDNCKIVSGYHNKPLLRYFPFESLMNIFYESNSLYYKLYTLLKIPLLPIWKYKSQRKNLKSLEKMVYFSDKVQLLSERFYPSFIKLVPQVDHNKLVAIGNPIVFKEKFPIEDIHKKDKKVLVVCSANFQKQVDIMLKIWAQIEQDKAFIDWSFDFVGGGEGFSRIIQLSKKLKLKRINFVGFQNPKTYYKRSSLFIMTSRFEGWPMVLMEAMQMGVVPIVYNSFESLIDIIDENENGVIIPNKSITDFVNSMKQLMQDDNERNRLAINAINKCSQYTVNKIYSKYLKVFQSIIDGTT